MNGLDIFKKLGWDGPISMSAPLLGAVVVLLLFALVWALWPRKHKSAADHRLSSNLRFSALAPINEEQVALLRYLQSAFPDGGVLFRPRLSYFLNVRSGPDRARARQWLAANRVDFLLCAEDGKPLYAFEVDMLRQRGDAAVQRRMADKNHVLKLAGIRLIRFKGALSTWPAPAVLRERVLSSSRPTPAATGFGESSFGASTYQQSGYMSPDVGYSEFANSQQHPSLGSPSGPISLTDLAGLKVTISEDADLWEGAGKRS